jgi:hydrogenase maturation protein HypF
MSALADSLAADPVAEARDTAELIRVRGLVQGVGFRPTVWRLARRYGLRGWVANDGDGVLFRLCGPAETIARLIDSLVHEAPPLARIDRIERTASLPSPEDAAFRIADSLPTRARTGAVPDAATCPQCRAEVFDAFQRRYRYPFTNCTDCGPRLSIIEAIPYDRPSTTMRRFDLCPACAGEYRAPDDRRFHAQPIACHACGPRAWLERSDGRAFSLDAITPLDAVDGAATLLMRGQILAIKGLGGFQLACDATNVEAVARLRQRKRRPRKPLALMVRDLDVARAYCAITELEADVLCSAAAPIVIVQPRADGRRVAETIAPGIDTLGLMLPNTPLHHLMLRRMDRPIVLTSGNLSDEPQCIDNDEARQTLGGIADYVLMHDRDIARRVDDSVVRIIGGKPRILRRARGYAPAPLPLPEGFAAAPPILATGGELKGAFCLLCDGQAILSHHMGDLENAKTFADYVRSIDSYQRLFEHAPAIIAIDRHPDYISAKTGRDLAARHQIDVAEVQHHHAHIAACLAENGVALDAAPVIGVALDGLGYGLDGALWGGEFLLADYRDCQRLATFKPVAMPGGAQAIREPWRNTYAHLMGGMGWARFAMDYAELPLHQFLQAKPRAVLDSMIARGVNSPLASSCGRLFDAAAAAAGICCERAEYEGQAAMEFEALVDAHTLAHEDERLAYPFAIPRLTSANLPYVEPLPMWQALLGDLIADTPVPVIAARFHKGLAAVIVRMVDKLRQRDTDTAPVTTVALSGGVLQNRVLLEQLISRLEALDLRVLTHAQVPANDGGLALGQGVIAAARAVAPGLEPQCLELPGLEPPSPGPQCPEPRRSMRCA